MAIEVVNPKGSETMLESFHFSQAAWNGDTLLCSGQLGIGADGKVPADMTEEFRHAWESAKNLLAEAGLGLDDVVEYTTYHVGLMETIGAFMAVRDEYLSEPWPAWTAIGVSGLAMPGARVELRITARRPE